MMVRAFRLVPGLLEFKYRGKIKQVPIWNLVDSKGKIRCQMQNPEHRDCAIQAIIMADLQKQTCAQAGIFLPEMISLGSFEA